MSLPTGPTSSTNAILEALRDALLTFENANGGRLSDTLGENLYLRRAPDNMPFPYGTLRLSTQRTSGYNALRQTAKLELQLYGRPSSQFDVLSDAADLCEQAMNFYVNSSAGQGLIFTNDVQRDELPQAGAPVDSETCTIRLVFTLAIWPAYLTSLTT
jgi:hypothetical protein